MVSCVDGEKQVFCFDIEQRRDICLGLQSCSAIETESRPKKSKKVLQNCGENTE